MKLNRRNFIVGAAIAPTVALVNPSFATEIRKPFVEVGERVDFLYFEDWNRPFQPISISVLVAHVGEWNGTSYNIVLDDSSPIFPRFWDGIDSEWCNFRKEVPNFRWSDVEPNKYPNIHSYIREKRFGEDPRLMRERMNRNTVADIIRNRETIPYRKTIYV